MRYSYTLGESKDKLISIVTIEDAYRSIRPKDSLLDRAQMAYLSIKERYGINVAVNAPMLILEMGCPPATFNDNFCGINGLLSFSERIVLDRFIEAVEDAIAITKKDEDLDIEQQLDNVLRAGFRALYKVNPHSKYNPYQETSFDMNLRSRFAAEVFGTDYWRMMLKPLFSLIDEYLSKAKPRWALLSSEAKEDSMTILADIFRHIVLSLTKQDLNKLDFSSRVPLLNKNVKELLRRMALLV